MFLLCALIQVYLIVCIARIILSWVPISEGTVFASIGRAIYALTEPVFEPVRRVLPRPGGLPIDFSPAVVILGLTLLRGVICGA